jgi:predicted nuclease of predicted toxin-antitoxin system
MPAFKLDENLSPALKSTLVAAGHDVATVADQSLGGASDSCIAAACKSESRCLITADEDFAQILAYPPEQYAGIVVLWHPRPTLQRLEELVRQVVVALEKETPTGRVWIVEPGRIRIHEHAGG